MPNCLVTARIITTDNDPVTSGIRAAFLPLSVALRGLLGCRAECCLLCAQSDACSVVPPLCARRALVSSLSRKQGAQNHQVHFVPCSSHGHHFNERLASFIAACPILSHRKFLESMVSCPGTPVVPSCNGQASFT